MSEQPWHGVELSNAGGVLVVQWGATTPLHKERVRAEGRPEPTRSTPPPRDDAPVRLRTPSP
jgi:hypothetical protein